MALAYAGVRLVHGLHCQQGLDDGMRTQTSSCKVSANNGNVSCSGSAVGRGMGCIVASSKTDGGVDSEAKLGARDFFESFLRRKEGQGSSTATEDSGNLSKPEISEEARKRISEKVAANFARIEAAGTQSEPMTAAPADVIEKPPLFAPNARPQVADPRLQYEERQRARETRRQLTLDDYRKLKESLAVTTLSIAGLGCLYCIFLLSIQTTVSYFVGSVFGFAYLQLLIRDTDSVSREEVPELFRKQKLSKDRFVDSRLAANSFEKLFQGSRFALSSKRLIVPGVMILAYAASQAFGGGGAEGGEASTVSGGIQLELAPLLLGFLCYKGAALVQAYKDNEDALIE